MARPRKPPGKEKWTWAEIRAGRRMSKGEKRARRLAKSFGAEEKPDGELKHTPDSMLACILIFAVLFLVAVVAECSRH